MTTKEMSMYDRYCSSSATMLCEVYRDWSSAKGYAYAHCLDRQRHYDGYDGRITSANTYIFCYAFRYMAEDGEHLRYMTGYNTYDFLIDCPD